MGGIDHVLRTIKRQLIFRDVLVGDYKINFHGRLKCLLHEQQ